MKHILIIGGGSIGMRHLRNLLSLGEKDVTVVEVQAARSEKIGKEFGVDVWSSLEQAFEEKTFDVALICTPTVYHLTNALACAKRGCDLFIEKPLANTLDGLANLTSLVKKKNLITLVGSNWKFYPSFQKMKELIARGTIGKVLSARCQFGQYLPDWHPWEDYRKGYSANKKLGGGILLDSHEFDYLTWFLGDVTKLACFADKVSDLEIDVEDVAEVILQFKNGAVGEIHLDYLQRFYQRNFEFFGEQGTISWDINLKKVILNNQEGGRVEFPLDIDYDVNDMYLQEMKHFVDCVTERKESITSAAKGVAVLRLICAARESSQTGRAVFL